MNGLPVVGDWKNCAKVLTCALAPIGAAITAHAIRGTSSFFMLPVILSSGRKEPAHGRWVRFPCSPHTCRPIRGRQYVERSNLHGCHSPHPFGELMARRCAGPIPGSILHTLLSMQQACQ